MHCGVAVNYLLLTNNDFNILFQFLHFRVQAPGRLHLVVDNDTVRQGKEVSRVALDDALHFLRAQRGDRAPTLALAAVLPPRSECRQSQLYGVIVRIWTQPWTKNSLQQMKKEVSHA